MIDFVRLRYKDNCKEVTTTFDSYSGEMAYQYSYIKKRGDAEIKANEKTVRVKRSIYNTYRVLQWEDPDNYNDFRYSALCSTINGLDRRITGVSKNRLSQLEFGLNIKLPEPAEDIIKQNVILHKLKILRDYGGLNSEEGCKQCNHYNYDFKIFYDKTKQYGLNEHIIRFEIKYKNSSGFKPLGIFNLHHLKSKTLLQNLFNDLLKRFDELTIVDGIPTDSKISDKDKRKLQAYLSDYFWHSLSENKNRNLKTRERKSFQRLLVKNDLLKTKTFLRASLIQKFNELLNS
jgi:hypothetical protein